MNKLKTFYSSFYNSKSYFEEDSTPNYLIFQPLNKYFNAKLSSPNRKIMENKTENSLVKNELNKLKTFDSDHFIGKSHFEEDVTQNYLAFQPLNNILK